MHVMGLQEQIGYVEPARRWWWQAIKQVAATRPGAWTLARVLPPIDRGTYRLTNGRVLLVEVVSGLQSVLVTTTGARSGLPRSVPLTVIPSGPDLAVIGTNFGGTSTPAWVHNLRADPSAVVERAGRRVPVRAVELTGAERDAVWEKARATYVGYGHYARRITGREITVWRLTPA